MRRGTEYCSLGGDASCARAFRVTQGARASAPPRTADRESACGHARDTGTAAARSPAQPAAQCGPHVARAGDAASAEIRPAQNLAVGPARLDHDRQRRRDHTGESLRRDHPRGRRAVPCRRVADSFGDAGRVGVRRVGGVARRRDGADAADARDRRGVRRRAPVRSAREHHGRHASAARAARPAPRQSKLAIASYNAGPTAVARYGGGAAVQRDQEIREEGHRPDRRRAEREQQQRVVARLKPSRYVDHVRGHALAVPAASASGVHVRRSIDPAAAGAERVEHGIELRFQIGARQPRRLRQLQHADAAKIGGEVRRRAAPSCRPSASRGSACTAARTTAPPAGRRARQKIASSSRL